MRLRLAALLLSVPLMVFSAELRLVDSIAVRAPSVELGEIATLDVADPDRREALAKLVVATAPRIGRNATISAFKVKALLRKAGMGDVIVRGLRTTVTTEARELGTAELEQRVQDWVLDQIPPEEELEVKITRLPENWVVPAGDDLELEIDAGHRELSGSMSLSLRARAGDQVLSTQRAQVIVQRYREVPVMIRPLMAGELLSEAHIDLQRVEVSRSSGMEVVDPQSVVGMVARRNLPVGTRPKLMDFEAPLMVERGQVTQIIVDNGSVRMKVSGAVALQNGREGDNILFSNPMNEQEPLRARVLRRGLALMKLN